jgi:hypothetical protein
MVMIGTSLSLEQPTDAPSFAERTEATPSPFVNVRCRTSVHGAKLAFSRHNIEAEAC